MPPEKRQQIIDDLRLFSYHTKMEYQKITNLLGTTPGEVPRFITKKWIEVHDQSGSAEDRYTPSKQIRSKTSMLRSHLCGFSDVCIVVKGRVTASFNPKRVDSVNNDFPIALFPDKCFPEGSSDQAKAEARNAANINAVNTPNAAGDRRNLMKGISFRKNAPFINCISKINGTLIDNAEDLEVAVLMYNLLEYSKNYSKTTGRLWNYYRDEPTSDGEINHYLGPKSFDFKSSNIGKLGDLDDDSQVSKNESSVAIPLKYLSNFWRSLKMQLLNRQIELILNWSTNCVILSNGSRDAIAATELIAANASNKTPAVNA